MRIIKVNQAIPKGIPLVVNPQTPLEIDAALRQLCMRHQFHYQSTYNAGTNTVEVKVSRFFDSKSSIEMKFDGGSKDALAYREFYKILNGEVVSELWPPIRHIARVTKQAPKIGVGIQLEDVPIAFWRRYAQAEYHMTDATISSCDWNGAKPNRTEYGWIGLSKNHKEIFRAKDGSPNPLVHEAESIIYNGNSITETSVLLGVSETLRKEIAAVEAKNNGGQVVSRTPISPARQELDNALSMRTTDSKYNSGGVTAAATSAASVDLGLGSLNMNKGSSAGLVNDLPKLSSRQSLSSRGGLQDALKNLDNNGVKLRGGDESPAATKAPVAAKKAVDKKAAVKKAAPKKMAAKKATPAKTEHIVKPAPAKKAIKKPIASKKTK